MELYNMVNYLKYGKKTPDKRCRKDSESLPEDLLQLGEVRQGSEGTQRPYE